ncbi:hypothetical protein G4B88_011719 [Cannabis sativa]|uniref:Ycf2 N-terminal domain-containing protein n=1 Tax=Cannabis sativa TaxID=3483 RepID=A0A7J6EY22_CANSA|nr:hypothetical protein G4B88_011719 [Cannabis sativa]
MALGELSLDHVTKIFGETKSDSVRSSYHTLNPMKKHISKTISLSVETCSLILYSFHTGKNCRKSFNNTSSYFSMISDDQDNSRETLSFHSNYGLQPKQIAFPIDLSPGLDLF